MHFLLPAVLAAVLMTGSAEAQPQTFAIMGLGTASCGSWTAARRSGQALGYEQWTVGFAAGTASALGPSKGFDPLRGLDANAVWAWIDNYCRVHPLETVETAAFQFVLAHPHP
jgi:hypothetical protein